MSQKKARAARLVERKKMEDLQERIDRLQEFVDNIDNKEDGPYFTCSMNSEHDEECKKHHITIEDKEQTFRTFNLDGHEISCNEIDKWDVAIALEEQKWAMADMVKQGVVHDIYNLDVVVAVLVDLVTELTGTTPEELNRKYKIRMYTKMHDFRENMEESIKEQRMRQMLTGGILGPDGRRINGG